MWVNLRKVGTELNTWVSVRLRDLKVRTSKDDMWGTSRTLRTVKPSLSVHPTFF